MHVMHLFYNLAAVILVLAAIPVFVFRLFREKGFAQRLKQSFGFLPEEDLLPVAGKDCVWLHAASVGEIVAASPIVKEFRKKFPQVPVLVSVVTANGYDMAKRIMKEADSIIFFPLDLPLLSGRVIRQVRPQLFLLVETELWPNFLHNAKKFNIPVMMVNGRISDKSVERYRYLGGILKNMLDTVGTFCMQSAIDAQYIIRLGADPRRVVVTGNTKFDQTYTDITPEEREELLGQLVVKGAYPVIVAGSTHRGEEELLFDAFKQVREHFPQARLIVAPRDTLRAEEVVLLADKYGLTAAKRTVLAENPSDLQQIVVVDTIGELGKIYSVGHIIFVGGSLIAHGGHNILEPAAHGLPIVVGPHMFNFKDSYGLFSERRACLTAYDQKDLAEIFLRILQDEFLREEMCRETLAIIRENQGASRKSVEYMKEVLYQAGKCQAKTSR